MVSLGIETELRLRIVFQQMANDNRMLRKLRLHVNTSVDGCIAGPNGEMDWMVGLLDDEIMKYTFKLHESVDTILLGRKMSDGFISYWSDVKNNPNDPWYAFAKKMIDIPKIVFTKTLNKSRWINTEIATGNLIEEVNKIKSQTGRDIIVYGGASFDTSLIKEKLIDEFYLFINPVAIGNGMTIFKDLNEIQKYILIESKPFECGKVLLRYGT
ncbi:MAG TPA: dihydrofolate reductase family protein [Nitrososphaeraceae archaeon]